jgi:cell division septal protein FtsQ
MKKRRKRVYYQKSYRIKKKSPVFKRAFFWPAILAFLCLGGLSYFFFLSPFFQIKEINIEGQEKVFEEDILNIINRKTENNLLFFKTKSIFLIDVLTMREDILTANPQVLGVTFERHLPSSLNVKISERKPAAVWCHLSECYFIDNLGIAFEKLLENSDLIKIASLNEIENFSLGEEILEKSLVSLVLEIQKKTEEKTGLKLLRAQVGSQNRIDFKTSEGWNVYFNTEEDVDWQITKLALVLEKEISLEDRGDLEYIDLRFARVYYK